MKRFYILLFGLFISSLVIAQGKENKQGAPSVHDPKAKEILDKVSVKTKAFKTIKADFVINRIDAKDTKKNSTQKGSISIKGAKYKLDIMGTITYSDGKTRWAYIKESKEINITTPDPKSDNLVDPSKVFTIYEKGYKYKFMFEKFEDGLQIYEIDLYPEALNTKLSKITLQIDKTSMQVHSIKYVEKDGVSYIIKVAKFAADADVSDADVTFNKANFPGAEIIDMRD